jgi:hypothetical protein
MTWPSLPRRNLDPAELQPLVDAPADEPDRWREHVAFSGDQRHYVSRRASVSYADELRPVDGRVAA